MSVFPPPNYTKITHNIRINTLQIQRCISKQFAKNAMRLRSFCFGGANVYIMYLLYMWEVVLYNSH